MARRAAGLTQHQLADLLGVPFRTIQSWETGARKPPEYVERLILEKLDDLTPGQWVQEDEDAWKCAKCGALWTFLDGGPVENGANHCPVCGKRMK